MDFRFEMSFLAWTLIDSVSVTSNNTLTINNEPTVIPLDLNLSLNQKLVIVHIKSGIVTTTHKSYL